MNHSSTSAGNGKPSKPDKPRPDFPLFPHATRRWAKKIRGKLHYFGPWSDPEGALNKYLDQKDDLHAGRTPRVQGDGLTVRDLLNRFLTSKRLQVDTRELSPQSFADYYQVCERIKIAFGLTRLVTDLASEDFDQFKAQIAKTSGPVTVGNEVQRARVVFNWAYHQGLIDRPIRYGINFKRPSKKVLRLARAAKGPRMFEAEELRRILRAAGCPLKAMILLGINCGFGNADCGTLPMSALDLEGRWVSYHRPKTGISRRCPLWPETVAALRTAIKERPQPKNEAHAGLVFITQRGHSWHKTTMDNPVSKEMAKLLIELKLHRPGLGFYALRHTFETIGGEAKDQVAVDHIMGHSRDDMASVYREKIGDERLAAVAQYVHGWLFKAAEKNRKPAKRAGKAAEQSAE